MMEEIITLNGKQFLIINEIDIYNTHYIYAHSIEDSAYTLLRQSIDNNEKYVESVTDEEEFELVMSMIAKENNVN